MMFGISRLRNQWRLTLVLCALLLSGCASNLYLTESEVAAFAQNMETAEKADLLFGDLTNEMLDVRFSTQPGPRFTISSSNTLDILRSMQRLAFVQDAMGQIRLERLATQLDNQLQGWINEQTTLASREAGSKVEITRVDRLTLIVLEAPTFSYDATRQAIRFQLRLRPAIHGQLSHRIFSDDIFGEFAGAFTDMVEGSGTSQGTNNVTIRGDNLFLQGEFLLQNAYRDAVRVVLQLEPEVRSNLDPDIEAAIVTILGYNPFGVTVFTSAPDQVSNAIRGLVRRNLAASRRETHILYFAHFSIPRLALSINENGEAELAHEYQSLLEPAGARVDVVMRDENGRLHHSRRDESGFSEPVQIPLSETIAGDPALVSSAPGVLELIAVADDGDLVHARGRSQTWEALWRASDDGALDRYNVNDRVGLTASGPGQLEVVAVSDSGWIFHLRRRNGVWLPPNGIVHLNVAADTALRDPVLVRVGFKLLLVCWDSNNKARVAVFDLQSGLWAQSFEIADNLAYAPTATALDDWRVGVAYVRNDGSVGYRVVGVATPMIRPDVGTTSASLYPDTTIGSGMDGPPVLVPTGYNSALLAVVGQDKKLKYNRVISDTWQSWEETSDRFFGTPASGNVNARFSLAATGAGQLHWVGRQRSSGDSRVIYNQHPGYAVIPGGIPATSPLHWRGYEKVSSTRFIGTPALAVNGRAMAVAVLDETFYPWTAIVGDDVPSKFLRTGTRATFGPDLVVLSTHVGQIDVVFLGEDNLLKHTKRLHNVPWGFVANLPSLPATPRTLTAVATPEQIDLVALAANGSLYYSRYARGNWSSMVGFGQNIASAPAMVDTGSGQLDIFAINNAGALWRWRLQGGQLTPGARINTPFEVGSIWFGPGSASSYGDGRVDIVVAEKGTRRLHHARLLPDSNNPIHPWLSQTLFPFEPVGVATSDLPVLTAIGPARMHLLVPGDNGQNLSGWLQRSQGPATLSPRGALTVATVGGVTTTRYQWGPFVAIDPGPGHVAGVARLGTAELAAPVSSRTGDLSLRRYEGWRWTGVEPVFGELAPVPDNRPSRVVITDY